MKIKRGEVSKSNNVKEALLGIIIGIVLLMFLVFGAKLIYEKPEYEDFCYPEKYAQPGEKLNGSEVQIFYDECSAKYDLANEKYSKNMFVFSLIIGVLVIVASIVFVDVNSVSGGLMLGSLMFVIYGTGSYWQYMNDWIRFIILGVVLGVLIYFGNWLNNRENKKEKHGKK